MNVSVKYLYHSGFMVSIDDTVLVFDYCEHSGAGRIEREDLEKYKYKFLFLSHSHRDHYTQEAFELPFNDILISDDFLPYAPGTRVSPGIELSSEIIKLNVFGSTDLGVSFLVNVHGVNIFHAGDFNFWHWDEESDEAYVKEAKALFDKVLEPIKAHADKIDIAFFPVDKRLGKNCGRGAELFIESIRPKYLIPMHTSDESGRTAIDFAKNEFMKTKVMAMTKRGEALDINL